MRALAIGLFCAAFVLAGPAVSQPVAKKRPSLRLIVKWPPVVRGANFGSGERVTLTLFVYAPHRKALVAGSAGGFTASFPRVRVPGCLSYRVTAVGARGSRASARHIAECPQAAALGLAQG